NWAWAKFRDRKYGEWFGYLNRQGTPSLLLKGGKWKAFFHLPRSLYFSIIQLKKISATKRK
ncbi:MAG: AGE family epimerase/isomerase, partial [Fibrobacteres bacterium]|nr:AGE family epimerase/isomerase [Fibrobacterota bacterium]